MKKLVLLTCLFAILSANLYSQTVSVENISANPGDTIQVPINLNSFTNIGAITLFIGFDTSVLDFDTLVNINPQFAGTMGNFMPNLQQVGIAWNATLSGINVSNGNFCELQFVYNGASSDLIFQSACEIADYNGIPLPVSYINGSVSFDSTLNVSFTGLNSTYCINSNSSILTAVPAGGIFSGQGMIGDLFNPVIASIFV